MVSMQTMHQGMCTSPGDSRISPTGVWPGSELDNPSFAARTSLLH